MGRLGTDKWEKAGGADKGEQKGKRRGVGAAAGGGLRTLAGLLLGIAVFVVCLHWEPAYLNIVQQLRLMPDADYSKLAEEPWVPAGAAAHVGMRGRVAPQEPGPTGEQFLAFDVCGDLATQRVAALSGLVLAAEANRTVVLPRLLLEGRPVDFGAVFDLDVFATGMHAQTLRLATRLPAGAKPLNLALAQQYDIVRTLAVQHAHTEHVKLSCPAFRLPPELYVKHERLVFAAAKAMQPVQPLMDTLQRIQRHLEDLSAGQLYNVLHLRAEEDWAAQCTRWEGSAHGHRLDNCMNNTDSVGDNLQVHNVDPQVPLLLVTGPDKVNDELVESAIASLEANSYKVVLLEDTPVTRKLRALTREEADLVGFYLALGAHQFVGNSVSLPDALLIMERWRGGRYATYYNGGNIPLEAFMPLFPMPWVFTYNDWSAGTEYDYMVKGAVMSAIEVARMKPFCMFTGSTESPMYQWLASKQITLIQHKPAWKDALIAEGMRGSDKVDKTALSHLYKNNGSIVGAYLRIDIPKLHEFDQYNYVLFTDCDVYFRKHMKLVDWGTPLPTAIGMGFERYDMFPYNDGVMLWNMPYMKKTNTEFIDWILSQHNGLYYGRYSVVDQGAFNQYYEKEVKGKPISRKFNAMIYHRFREDARIVHLHGPKPNHYLEWLRTGSCSFGDMCSLGIYGGGFCKYASEYRHFVPEWQVVHKVHRLCSNLAAGTWHPPV